VAVTNPLQVMPSMEGDLARVESGLLDAVRSADPFLTEIASHLISAGGKRVRPGFSIAAAATASRTDAPASTDAVTGAVAVELVHLGSLYHDDVMDEAVVRRTVDSVNARWGNHKAILAGDYLLAKASELASSLGVEVASLLARTIARLCEGQLLELRHSFDTTRTEESYLQAIEGKTASLLGTSRTPTSTRQPSASNRAAPSSWASTCRSGARSTGRVIRIGGGAGIGDWWLPRPSLPAR